VTSHMTRLRESTLDSQIHVTNSSMCGRMNRPRNILEHLTQEEGVVDLFFLKIT